MVSTHATCAGIIQTGNASLESLLTNTQQAGQDRLRNSTPHHTCTHRPTTGLSPLTFLLSPSLGDFPVLQQSLGVLDL